MRVFAFLALTSIVTRVTVFNDTARSLFSLIYIELPFLFLVATFLFALSRFDWAVAVKNRSRIAVLTVFFAICLVPTLLYGGDFAGERLLRVIFVPTVIIAFGYLLPTLFTQKDYLAVLKPLVLVIVFYSALSLYLSTSGSSTVFGISAFFNGVTKQDFFTYGIYNNRNRSAHCTQWVPAVAAYLAIAARGKERYLWSFCGLIAFVHILFTFSRGAQLGMLISLAPAFWVMIKTRKNLSAAIFSSLVVGGVLLFLNNDFARTKYFSEFFSLRDRDILWKESLTHLTTGYTWIFGSGLWGYRPENTGPHNSFLAHFLYFGIIGFSAFLFILKDRLAFLIRSPKALLKEKIGKQLLSSSIVGLLVTALFEDTLVFTYLFPGVIFWFLVGMMNPTARKPVRVPPFLRPLADVSALKWSGGMLAGTLAIAAALCPPVWKLKDPIVDVPQSKDGSSLIVSMSPGSPDWITPSEVSPHFLRALILKEDRNFLRHGGIDLGAIRDSFRANLSAGEIVRGGSTLTQQLVRTVFLSSEKTYLRKIREVIGAVVATQILSKEETLQWYLNVVQFGPDIYGIRTAAQHYFEKLPSRLSLEEAVMLVTVLPNPRQFGKELKIGKPSAKLARTNEKVLEMVRLNLLRQRIAVLSKYEDTFVIPESELDSKTRERTRLSHYFDKPEGKKFLAGLRVALDPGHFGGDLSEWEGRFIEITLTDGTKRRIAEGDLTLLTAFQLKDLLEMHGASVFLTREEIGTRAIQTPTRNIASESFEKSNNEDLKSRIRRINNFKPHLTIVLHFNAVSDKQELKSQSAGSRKNYSLVMVPGAFRSEELSSVDTRKQFDRLIASDDLGFSLKLAKNTIRAMRRNLTPDVPEMGYLSEDANFLDAGVYSRNLALLREVESAIVYGEPLNQSNYDEALRLSEKDVLINGVPTSSRLLSVADSYLEGILETVRECRRMDCGALSYWYSR